MSGLNAYDEGKRRGKDRADFERGYAEAHQGLNAGDTPGSGIRGSGGLSPKPSIDVATTDPRYFKGGTLKQDVLIAGANPGSRTANTVNVSSVMDGRVNGGPDANAVKIPEAVAATPAPANPAPEKSMTNWGTANAPRQIGFREAGFNSQQEMDVARATQPVTAEKTPTNPAWQQAQANANTQAAATRQRLDQAGTHESGFALGNAVRADTIAQAQKALATPSLAAMKDPAAAANAAAGQAALIGRVNDQQTAANAYQQNWRAGQAAQANSVPMTKAPAAASITAVSSQPQAPAPVAPQQIKGYLPNGLPEQAYKGSAMAKMTNAQLVDFFKANPNSAEKNFIPGYGGASAAPAQVASTPAPASEVAATQVPEIAAEPAPEREGSAEFESAPSAPAAKPSLLDTLRDIGKAAPLDVNNTNVVVQDNPAQSIRVPMQTGGTSAITGQKIVPMSDPSQAAIASGVKNLNAQQANVDAFNANQQLGRDSRAKSAADTQAILAKNAKAQSDWQAKKSGALPSPEAVAGAQQVPSPSPATINSAFDAIPSTAPSVAIAGLTPAPVINAGPDPVQPMAPQSVANMDVPTLFKRPGGVRGQSRTSVIKPTPFYQL